MPLPTIDDKTPFKLVKGQDIIGLAINFGSYGIAKYALQSPTTQPLLGCVDSNQSTHLMLMAHYELTPDMRDFFLNTPIHKEFPVMPEGYSYTRELLQYKRVDHLVMLLEFLKANQAHMDSFYFQLTSCVRGRTVFDVIRADINYAAFRADAANKERLLRFCERVVPQALRRLQQQLLQYRNHIASFFRANRQQIDPGAPELSPDEMIALATGE